MTDDNGNVVFSLLAGWQTGVSAQAGVAFRVAYFASPDQLYADAPQAIQLLLTPDAALELGEELLRQGRCALGASGRN